jgi:acetyltransferase-like isoleucine patch superfamily enzyme
MKDQPTYVAKVIIEDDVWIGANATILPGVRVGKGSVIGAGSVVTNDIPEYSIAVGIPARVISKRG